MLKGINVSMHVCGGNESVCGCATHPTRRLRLLWCVETSGGLSVQNIFDLARAGLTGTTVSMLTRVYFN